MTEESLSLEQLKENYPGVDLAYNLAVSAYDVVSKRLDAVDNRLQTILTLGIAVSLPILPLASAKNIPFRSLWFYVAALAFVAAIVTAVIGRVRGRVIALHPATLYEKWLHYSEWEFKKNFIHFAGEHFEANRQLVDRRNTLTVWASILFLAEALAVAVWVWAGR